MTAMQLALLCIAVLVMFKLIGEFWNEWVETFRLLTMAVAWVFLFGSLVVSCNQSEWYQKQEQERQQKNHEIAVQERTPRLVSEAADGCKVFTFKTDRWYYYTRCPNSVTTTNTTYTTSCGKNCRKEHVNAITTEDK